MAVSMADITKLRKMTGAGMMDCKNALTESEGDFDKAVEIIRKKGQAVAAKRSDRETSEGCVLAKSTGDYAAMIALKCETDFVAKNEKFKTYVAEVAAQAVNTKEVSTWQSPRGKYPVRDVIRDVLLTGSSPLPRLSRARSAALCTSLTECARNAVPTTAVRSRSSSPRSQPNN